MQKIENIDNRLKNNRNTIIFTIISGVSKVDDLKIKWCYCTWRAGRRVIFLFNFALACHSVRCVRV
jgi:hypothetical protein